MCETIETLLDDAKKKKNTPSEVGLTLKNFNENLLQKDITKSISDI